MIPFRRKKDSIDEGMSKLRNAIAQLFAPVDLTHGNPAKRLIHFSIPILLSSILSHAFSLINSLILKVTVGGDAVTAISSTGSISALLLNFAYGCTSGFAVIMANRKGANDEEGLKKTFTSCTILAIIIAILITGVGFFAYVPLIKFLNINEVYVPRAKQYYQLILGGFILMLLANLLANFLTALGNSSMSLLFSFTTTVASIGLGFFFTGVVHWDVRGVAAATLIANFINVSLHLIYMRKKIPWVFPRFHEIRLDRKTSIDALKMGLPLGFQWSILFFGSLYQARRVNAFGDGMATKAVACYSSWEGYLSMPINVISSALLHYIGQNFGAKDKDRIRQGIRISFIIDTSAWLIMMTVGLTTAKYIPYIFLPKEEVNDAIIFYASTYIRIMSVALILQATLTQARSILQGIKKPLIPFISGVGELAVRILVCMFIPNIINPENPLSDESYIGISFSNASAWLVSVLIMGSATIYYVYIKKLHVVDVQDALFREK